MPDGKASDLPRSACAVLDDGGETGVESRDALMRPLWGQTVGWGVAA